MKHSDSITLNNFYQGDEEVLGKDLTGILRRKVRLERAAKLGNLHNIKSHIIYYGKKGLEEIEGIINKLTATHVFLKNNASIPINRIFEVNY